jgi:hypothetical protein
MTMDKNGRIAAQAARPYPFGPSERDMERYWQQHYAPEAAGLGFAELANELAAMWHDLDPQRLMFLGETGAQRQAKALRLRGRRDAFAAELARRKGS